MKHGDLAFVVNPFVPRWAGRSVLCVVLRVTRHDIQLGVNARRPGLYLFRGYWHGSQPLNIKSYGKIEGQVGKVVGRLTSHAQARRLGI